MKNPEPQTTDITKCKRTTLKTYLTRDLSRKEWARIQKKNLEAFRGLPYGDWPVDRILDERHNAKHNHRLEYLVRWEEHPFKRATWAPEWVGTK